MAEPQEAVRHATYQASDGHLCYYHHYPVAQAPCRARVICLHGIQSHAGWYEHSSQRFAQEGFETFFLNRRGSGIDPIRRGDTPSFRRLLDDVADFLRPLRQTPNSSPILLHAVSWGGKLAVALQRRHPGLVDGLALLCPGLFPRVQTTLGTRLAIALSSLIAPEKKYPIPLSDPELFTTSPTWQRFLREDPLALHEASARFLLHSARLDGYLRFTRRYVRAPVLLLLAGQDRIIDNVKTRRFVTGFASADKTVYEYPEAHHTLEFEPPPARFLEELVAWMKRVARGTGI